MREKKSKNNKSIVFKEEKHKQMGYLIFMSKKH